MIANEHKPADIVFRGTVLAISRAISYFPITHILASVYSIPRDNDLLGGMSTVSATISVYRDSREESTRAAISCMAATSVSLALCFVYLLLFPFHLWGMATLIGLGVIVVTLVGRPGDTITTGIATVSISGHVMHARTVAGSVTARNAG